MICRKQIAERYSGKPADPDLHIRSRRSAAVLPPFSRQKFGPLQGFTGRRLTVPLRNQVKVY